MFTGLTLPHGHGHLHADTHADAAWIADHLGRTLGREHRIVRHLASGAMAHVFVAEHVRLGTYAVAKLPRPDHPPAAATIAFEAELLGRVAHPNIVQIIEYGSELGGGSYLLLEYADGIELDVWLEYAGALPVAQGLAILSQLAAALDHLHAHGIVHSDVKPANVLWNPTQPASSVKLIDFGVAFLDATHGQQRAFTGTPAYMAPEQGRGRFCGATVDVYGLAALAYELLTGHLMCEYPTRQAALDAALRAAPALLQSALPGDPRAVLSRALQDDPDARFHCASEFVTALEHTLVASDAGSTR